MGTRRALLEESIRHLATIERGSASPGEREAAEWIAARLGELGCPARIEEEPAHGGVLGPPRLVAQRFPAAIERADRTFPVISLVWLGPVLVGLGSLLGRRGALAAGTVLAAGSAGAMLDIGLRAVVPGANDNLSAVGVLLALAAELGERPVEGVRVLLVSTGAEESFMEGMQGFMRRHRPTL